MATESIGTITFFDNYNRKKATERQHNSYNYQIFNLSKNMLQLLQVCFGCQPRLPAKLSDLQHCHAVFS